MATTLTQQEVTDAITKWVTAMNNGDETFLKTWSPRAGITSADIVADAAAIKTKDDLQLYFTRGTLPGNKKAGIFGQSELKGGDAVGGLKAGASLVKALLSRGGAKVAAEEAAATGAKGVIKKALSTKPRKIAAVVGATAGFNALANGNKPPTADATTSQSETDLVNALNTAAQNGVDQAAIINGPIGKQLGLDKNSGAAIIAKYGGEADASIGGNIGVYTGTSTTSGKMTRSGTFIPTNEPSLVSLGNWKKQFPIADAKGQADFKNKLIDAGLPAAGYGIPELQKAWEQFGQLSLDASRSGHNMTPWDMINLTKSLSTGGANKPSVSYSVNTSTPGEVRSYLNRQLENNLGRQATEGEFKAFLKEVAAGEKKNPSKTVTTTAGGVSRSTTTGGYGVQDVLTAADKFSQKSPDYAQRQTEMVFGDGLKKALGI